jgi:hypothetical protein
MSRNVSRTKAIPGLLAKTFQAQDTLLSSRGEATVTTLAVRTCGPTDKSN